MIPLNATLNEIEQQPTGLQMIGIYSTYGVEPNIVIQLLGKNQTMMEQLIISVDSIRRSRSDYISERWVRIAGIKADNLEHMTYALCSSHDMHNPVASMIRNW